MKKILILFIGIITLFTVGCGHGSIDEITYNEYKEMVENEESFILFIGSHECSHCAEFEITLEKVIDKYSVHFKYIDIANLSNEDYAALKKDITFTGTPTTVFIEDGVDNSCNVFTCDKEKRIDGALDYDTVIARLKSKGYIKR